MAKKCLYCGWEPPVSTRTVKAHTFESCVERLHKQLAEMTTRAKEAEDQVEYLKEYKVKYERSIDNLKVE